MQDGLGRCGRAGAATGHCALRSVPVTIENEKPVLWESGGPIAGKRTGRYLILRELGSGGMGTVYLAEDTNLKRRVALKFLSANTASDSDAAARLLREAWMRVLPR